MEFYLGGTPFMPEGESFSAKICTVSLNRLRLVRFLEPGVPGENRRVLGLIVVFAFVEFD